MDAPCFLRASQPLLFRPLLGCVPIPPPLTYRSAALAALSVAS